MRALPGLLRFSGTVRACRRRALREKRAAEDDTWDGLGDSTQGERGQGWGAQSVPAKKKLHKKCSIVVVDDAVIGRAATAGEYAGQQHTADVLASRRDATH